MCIYIYIDLRVPKSQVVNVGLDAVDCMNLYPLNAKKCHTALHASPIQTSDTNKGANDMFKQGQIP